MIGQMSESHLNLISLQNMEIIFYFNVKVEDESTKFSQWKTNQSLLKGSLIPHN